MNTSGWRRWITGLGLAGLLALAACGGGSDEPAAPATGTVTGRAVASADAAPLADARVSIGAVSTRTGADGSFTLADVPAAARAVLRVEAAGYVDALVAVPVRGGATVSASARLLRAADPVTFDAATAATVTAPGSTAQVALPASSLVVQATGAPATGTLTARVTPIDPAADPQSMPGDYSVSDTVRIESFGAINVTLQDANGAPLQLRAGSRATIRIPLASRAATPPATIPLYWFDESTGRWVQEGSATLAGTAPDRYYEGTVSHFTTWNADQEQDTIYVNGCVRDATGAPIEGAEVSTVGIDYSGTGTDISAATGSFRVPMKRGGRANLFADNGRTSNTVVVGPSQTDITLETCLVITGDPLPPAIVEQPVGATLEESAFYALRVTTSGTRPMRYQWQRNGVAIPGATFDWLPFASVQPGDAGVYRVVVTNAVGTVTSTEATITVNPAIAPSIVTPPAAASVAAGASASFTVVADGTAPLAFQWQRNGTDIAGATAATYTTPPTVLGDSGAVFRVRVSNRVGAATSAGATLTVTGPALAAPVITTQPADTAVPAGLTASFSVQTTGSPLPTYQWRRNGTPIAGATAASYTTPVLTAADNGALYSVVATNSEGSATSRDALLTVTANATEDRIRLMRLLGLAFEFYQAASAPLLLVDDDGNLIAAASACDSGTLAGTLNGGALPAPGTALPASGTLAATASACRAAGGFETYTGASTVTFNLTGRNPEVGSATAVVTDMRITSTTDGTTIDSDITANGNGSVSFGGSVAGTDTTSTVALTPAAGATLRNGLSGLTATFASGSLSVLTVERAVAPPVGSRLVRLRASYANLAFSVAGTSYLADGFYELNFADTGLPAGGSGEVVLTSGGARVGRIYATAEGIFIEVDGVVQPFKAASRAHAR